MKFFKLASLSLIAGAAAMLTPITRIGTTPRAQMVRKLADIVVLPAGRISSNERSLVADILLQIVDKVEVDLRIEVATRVARVPESPPALTRMVFETIAEDALVLRFEARASAGEPWTLESRIELSPA